MGYAAGMTDAGSGVITWRRVTERDFPLLQRWLREPHVARWWNHETSDEAVARDFGASARGEEPSQDWLALVDGLPVGLVQRCLLADYPDYLEELAEIVDVPEHAATIDYLIGAPEHVGRGIGPRIIRSMLELTWADHPETTAVLVPVAAANRRSWRALEKAGLRRVAEGELTPDNPIDDRLHYLYRVDRSA